MAYYQFPLSSQEVWGIIYKHYVIQHPVPMTTTGQQHNLNSNLQNVTKTQGSFF